MAIGEKTKPIVIYAPIDIKARIEEMAKNDGRSVSNYLLQLLEKHVQK